MELIVLAVVGFFLVIAANLAETRPRLAFLIDWSWFAISLACFLAGSVLLFASLTNLPGPWTHPPDPRAGVVLLIASVLALLILIRPVRLRLSSLMDIRPDSPVHLTALFLSIYLIAWSLFNLSLLEGVSGLLEAAENVPIWMYVIQAVAMTILALLGVGLTVRRSWSEVLVRLGLARFQWFHLVVAALALVVLLVSNVIISGIWALIDPAQVESIGEVTKVMLGNFDTLPSILLLAVLSGVSEETLFRGALQPRLGVVFTAVLFASTHIQYSLSPATLIVLFIGLALGLLRRYFGTWTAILTHFGYNLSLLLLGLVARRLIEMMG